MNTMHEYEVDVKWQGERKGFMISPELPLGLEVATPPEFPKGMKDIWSPEHLYTAAVASCLMTTFLAIAENSKLEFRNFDVKSKGILQQVDGKFLMTEVQLFPMVEIARESDRERTNRIIRKAEAACLISNSIKSKVTSQPEIKVAAVTV
jgi:peroxiredoxin-like protein